MFFKLLFMCIIIYTYELILNSLKRRKRLIHFNNTSVIKAQKPYKFLLKSRLKAQKPYKL